MRQEIIAIVNRSLAGDLMTKEDLKALLMVEDFSEEYHYIIGAGRQLSTKLAKGEIHGQIGVDLSLCPRNCQYCSFAAINKVFHDYKQIDLDQIIEGVLSMEAQGANAIYLMATERYDFDQFIEIAKQVKAAMKSNVPLVANVDDFDEEGAKQLVEAGFAGVYHAIRMGEGSATSISIEKRKESIKIAQEAGLKVGMCVEPIGPEHRMDEIVEKTMVTRELNAVFSGAMRRTNFPGSQLERHGQMSYAGMAKIVAAVSLATGHQILGNCTHEPNELGVNAGANLLWAEVGSNPRDTNEETVRGWTVNRCRELYHECGLEVLEGPSAFF